MNWNTIKIIFKWGEKKCSVKAFRKIEKYDSCRIILKIYIFWNNLDLLFGNYPQLVKPCCQQNNLILLKQFEFVIVHLKSRKQQKQKRLCVLKSFVLPVMNENIIKVFSFQRKLTSMGCFWTFIEQHFTRFQKDLFLLEVKVNDCQGPIFFNILKGKKGFT